jgi:hypothetical protein
MRKWFDLTRSFDLTLSLTSAFDVSQKKLAARGEATSGQSLDGRYDSFLFKEEARKQR